MFFTVDLDHRANTTKDHSLSQEAACGAGSSQGQGAVHSTGRHEPFSGPNAAWVQLSQSPHPLTSGQNLPPYYSGLKILLWVRNPHITCQLQVSSGDPVIPMVCSSFLGLSMQSQLWAPGKSLAGQAPVLWARSEVLYWPDTSQKSPRKTPDHHVTDDSTFKD